MLEIEKKCMSCQKGFRIPITKNQLKEIESGVDIQVVLPHLSAGDRELLISGFCGKCFDGLFENNEGDES